MKTKRTTLTIGLAIVCAAFLGGWVSTRSYGVADAPATKPADDELQRLLTARFDSATKAWRMERSKLDSGKSTYETVYLAAQRVLDAEMALSSTAEGRITALTKYAALMRQFEQEVAKRATQGALPPGEDETPRYLRLTAEVELLRIKRGATK